MDLFGSFPRLSCIMLHLKGCYLIPRFLAHLPNLSILPNAECYVHEVTFLYFIYKTGLSKGGIHDPLWTVP